MFQGIRKSSVGILLASVVFFTLAAILGIWEVLDVDVMARSLASLGVIIGATILIIFVTLERDRKWIFAPRKENDKDQKSSYSLGKIILIVIGILVGLWILSSLFSGLFYLL